MPRPERKSVARNVKARSRFRRSALRHQLPQHLRWPTRQPQHPLPHLARGSNPPGDPRHRIQRRSKSPSAKRRKSHRPSLKLLAPRNRFPSLTSRQPPSRRSLQTSQLLRRRPPRPQPRLNRRVRRLLPRLGSHLQPRLPIPRPSPNPNRRKSNHPRRRLRHLPISGFLKVKMARPLARSINPRSTSGTKKGE